MMQARHWRFHRPPCFFFPHVCSASLQHSFYRRHPMQAWLCENPSGVDALTWKELPTPQPGKGEVLIEIKAASLNFPDLLIVQNKYQIKPPLPFVPGSEYAGVVAAVGEGVTHLKPG